jgi:hypothetical protein
MNQSMNTMNTVSSLYSQSDIQFCKFIQKPNTKKIEIVFPHSTRSIDSESNQRYTMDSTTTIKTYRHEFSKEFMAELSRFSKVHQYDDRHTYKSEWQKWINQEKIAQAMDYEKRRLQENGYIGDIDDKMFKAGRYYFRKKTTKPVGGAVTPNSKEQQKVSPPALCEQDLPIPATPKTPATTVTTNTRRTYITMSKQCIQMMDNHISEIAATTTTTTAANSTQFKPSTCYTDFYNRLMTTQEMTKEIDNIVEKYEKTPGAMANLTAEQLTLEIMDKIKKTYKNRYYKFISASRNNNNNDNDNDNNN